MILSTLTGPMTATQFVERLPVVVKQDFTKVLNAVASILQEQHRGITVEKIVARLNVMGFSLTERSVSIAMGWLEEQGMARQ